MVINNFVFIIEEIRKHLSHEKDRLAKKVFQELLVADKLRFLVIGEDIGFKFPKKITVKTKSPRLRRSDHDPLQRSLFEFVPEEQFNETEKAVAWYKVISSQIVFGILNRY